MSLKQIQEAASFAPKICIFPADIAIFKVVVVLVAKVIFSSS
jgi:hypothetical protein